MSSNIRSEKKQLPSSSLITSLPEDVVVDILARVPRRDYPRVSLVSKYFRSLVLSPVIYARRSSLSCTEHCLYVVLHSWDDGVSRLYTLHHKVNGNSSRLVLISCLPDMPHDGSFVAVGSRIYVFSEINSFIIDCSTSHTVQHLPSMPVPMSNIVAEVICGRIYVFGYLGGTDPKSKGMLVFDTETQTWEDGMTKPVMVLGDVYKYRSVVVMADKMYTRDLQKSFVYEPKESKWELDEMLSSEVWVDACVVDDILYFYDQFDKESINAYDPEHRCWQVVKGVEDLLAEIRRTGCGWFKTVSCGGKLVLLFAKGEFLWETREICCAEISLERLKGGQIWGRVDQWCDNSLIAGNFIITKSLDVVL